jgi:pyruvate dehydrogenase (quinone)
VPRTVARNVADVVIETLAEAGVRRIYGVVGDSLNAVTEALRRNGTIQWVPVRHEEVAAFAAGAEAHLTGSLAVCAGTCGPGNLHLINGLYDCHRSGVPVLALAAHIPSAEIGSNYFQETHPQFLFRECSHYCELLSSPVQTSRMLDAAMRHALAKRGVGVIVFSGDTAFAAAEPAAARGQVVSEALVRPRDADLDRLAEMLNRAERVTLLCGSGCAGAHELLLALAEVLKAPMVHTLRGKEYVEYDNPYDVGMTGLIGFSSGYYAMKACQVLLMLGTDFPYRQFYPTDARIVQVDIRPEKLGRRAPLALGLTGDVRETLMALLPRLRGKADRSYLDRALKHYRNARKGLDERAGGRAGGPLHPQQVTRVLSELASEDAVFTCDVGLPTVWGARYLAMNGRRRLLGSFWHGSMANAMAQAIGAQAAQPQRQVISLSGDGGFSMLMGDILTLLQLELPVKVVVLNNRALGFVEIEQIGAGLLSFGTHLVNPDFAAMAQAIGIKGVAITDPAEVESGLAAALAHPGPVLVDARVSHIEVPIPPKITAEMARGFTLYMLKAVMNERADEVVELARTNIFR